MLLSVPWAGGLGLLLFGGCDIVNTNIRRGHTVFVQVVLRLILEVRNPVMYLKQVTIENFRGIADMTLELQPGINLLIGDNGVGKTSVLEAIVAGLGACFKEIPAASAVSIKPDDVRQELHVIDDSPFVKYHTPVRVTCQAQIGEEVYTWSRSRKNEAPKKQTVLEYADDSARIADWFRDAANEPQMTLPVLNYQSINRVANRRNSDFSSSTRQFNDRRCGYTGCMDSALDDKFIRKWCYAMMRKSGKSPRYDLFRSAVVHVMRRMEEDRHIPDLYFSEEFGADGEFVYEEDGRAVPITFLSAGYQSCLWMVMEIAFRALLLNPGTTALSEITGIVLIDEVDKHLHPKWQWNVLGALRETFPNIQFIITTHAPIVIGSCREAAIVSIAADQLARPISSVYGYTIEDVVERTQGSPAAIRALKELYIRFEEACIGKDLQKAQQYFEEIEREFPNSTERTKARTKLGFLKLRG